MAAVRTENLTKDYGSGRGVFGLPIAGLDPLVQRSFHDLLGEVRAQGRTVLLSSHTLSEADRVAVLRAGKLAVVDTLEHLRAIAVPRCASCAFATTTWSRCS